MVAKAILAVVAGLPIARTALATLAEAAFEILD
jgi:hypothetical protein